jgi:hypothetical protein
MWVTPPPEFVPVDWGVRKSWMLGTPVPGVKFKMQEAVNVVAGVGAGERGELINLYAVTPEPLYHVETSNNEDLYARESELERRTQ